MKINETKINGLLTDGIHLLSSRLTSYKNMDDAAYFGFLIANILQHCTTPSENRTQ
jgi:hypothetical protein